MQEINIDWIKHLGKRKNDKSASTVYWMDTKPLDKKNFLWSWSNLECLYREVGGVGDGGGRGGEEEQGGGEGGRGGGGWEWG